MPTSTRKSPRHNLLAVLGFLVAAGLALVGQRWIWEGTYRADGVALLLAGGGLLLILLLRRSGPLAASLLTLADDGQNGTGAERWRARPGLRRLLLVVTLVSAVIAFEQAGGNLYRPLGVAAWVLAVGSFGLAFGDFRRVDLRGLRSRLRAGRDAWRSGPRIRLSWELTVFLAIWLLGCFLLFYRLPEVPEEMISDHIDKLIDIQGYFDGEYKIYTTYYSGSETTYFYLSAVLVAAGLGFTYMALKVGAVLIGVFAIPATFGLTRVWFGVPVALTATFFVATSRWYLIASRGGFRYVFSPVFAALTGLFLLRALRYRQRNDFLLLGFVLGVGMYTYTAVRIIPLAVIACLWVELMLDITRRPDGWERARRTIVNVLLAAVVALLVLLPLSRFALEHPDDFWRRSATRIASAERPLPGDPLTLFLDNIKNASLMFNYRGDIDWTYNVPFTPAFDYVTGACFFLGTVYALYRLLAHRERIYGYLLVFLFVALLPSILSLAFPVENPAIRRTSMALPIAALLAALPVGLLMQSARRLLPSGTAVIALMLVLVPLGGHIWWINHQNYFVDFARQYKITSQNGLEVARVINGFADSAGDTQDAWMKNWPHWVDYRIVAVEIGQPRWSNFIDDIAAAREHDVATGPRLYVLSTNDHESHNSLVTWYPHAIIRDHLSPVSGEVIFRSYFIPPVPQ